MKRATIGVIAAALALSACSGGSQSAVTPATQMQVPAQSASVAENAVSPDRKHHKEKFARLEFTLRVPHKHERRGDRRSPAFIPPSTASVKITLLTVNGAAPPSGLTLVKTTNLTSMSCGNGSGCKVTGPASPIGSDSFNVTIYDSQNHPLSTATQTFVLHLGVANTGSLTLLGVPSSFTLTGVPAGTAGTGITNHSLTLVAKDAAGDAITGTYANPVSIAALDPSGATTLSLNSAAPSGTVISTQSTDTLSLSYTGEAIVSTSLSVTATGATTLSVPFTVTTTPPTFTCNGDGSGTSECGAGNEIDLYATSGTGSTATFTAAQPGWGALGHVFTQTNTCSAIATVSTSDGLTFTVTALNAAVAGTCAVTVTGGAGQHTDETVTFTTSSIGVNGRHHGTKPVRKP